MVNVLGVAKGSILEYGETMECDRVLKEWISSLSCFPFNQGEGEKWGKFVMIDAAHKQLTQNIAISKSSDGNFEEFVRITNNSMTKESSLSSWLERSGQMIEFGKLLNQKENQQLSGLVLSSSFGKPLRYCIQHEILPSANYWGHYAEMPSSCHLAKASKTVVVVVGSSTPILAMSRALSPIMSQEVNVILVPLDETTSLPCLLMAELLNKAGLGCSVYAASQDRIKEIVNLEEINVIVCGSHNQACSLRNGSSSVELDLDGKKAFVATDTGDHDAVVDAAIVGLKTSGHSSPGLYLIVQESVLEEITWRLHERFTASRSGDLLNKMVDFSTDSRFGAPKLLTDYLEGTQLNVLTVGNARIVFDAQPSMPLTQLEKLGQTLLVFCYRSVNELVNLVGNFPDLGELSLWSEQQTATLDVINRIQVPRIWVNGSGVYEPGYDRLVPVKVGQLSIAGQKENAKVNTSLYAALDGLLSAQRSWSAQKNRNLLVCRVLKHLLQHDLFSKNKDHLVNLLSEIRRDTGKFINSSIKRGIVLDLETPVGVVAVIASGADRLDSLVNLITSALVSGNALVLCVTDVLSPAIQTLVKVVKDVGIPNVLVSLPVNDENSLALLSHHGTRMVVLCSQSTLPTHAKNHTKRISSLEFASSRTECLRVHKCVWLASGEGLGN